MKINKQKNYEREPPLLVLVYKKTLTTATIKMKRCFFFITQQVKFFFIFLSSAQSSWNTLTSFTHLDSSWDTILPEAKLRKRPQGKSHFFHMHRHRGTDLIELSHCFIAANMVKAGLMLDNGNFVEVKTDRAVANNTNVNIITGIWYYCRIVLVARHFFPCLFDKNIFCTETNILYQIWLWKKIVNCCKRGFSRKQLKINSHKSFTIYLMSLPETCCEEILTN